MAVWTNVFVDEFGFALQDSDASAVEPILTFIAANVESVEMFKV